jgi:HNH endonuclease/AP2 domain
MAVEQQILNDHDIQEDYTGSVTLLLPKGEWTIIDIDIFAWACEGKWRVFRQGKRCGLAKEKCKRVVRYHDGRTSLMHREITNAPKGLVVDHKNHQTVDNRRSNLRVCTVRENNLNCRGQSSTSSRFKGVAWEKRSGKWKVITGKTYEKVYLGAFDCEIEAARTYNKYAKEHYGPMAYLNPV